MTISCSWHSRISSISSPSSVNALVLTRGLPNTTTDSVKMYNCYTPAETAEIVSRAGMAKANTRLDKVFMSSVMAGMLLAFACATLISTNASPWYQSEAPGLIRTIAALVFPYGLCMVVLTGSDLCTGSFLVGCPRSPPRQRKRLTLATSLPRLLSCIDACPFQRCCCTGSSHSSVTSPAPCLSYRLSLATVAFLMRRPTATKYIPS